MGILGDKSILIKNETNKKRTPLPKTFKLTRLYCNYDLSWPNCNYGTNPMQKGRWRSQLLLNKLVFQAIATKGPNSIDTKFICYTNWMESWARFTWIEGNVNIDRIRSQAEWCPSHSKNITITYLDLMVSKTDLYKLPK